MFTKKRILLIILCCVVFFVLFFLRNDIEKKEKSIDNGKHLELNGLNIIGFNENRKTWQINAEHMWTGRSQYLFRLEGVYKGQVFNNYNQVIIDGLSSDTIKVNSKSKMFTAEDNIKATLINRGIDPNDPSKRQDITVLCNMFRYFNQTQQSKLSGNVKLIQKDATIYPQGEVTIDHDKHLAIIEDGVIVKSQGFEVYAKKMFIDIVNHQAVLSGGVRGFREADQKENVNLDFRERDMRSKRVSFSCGLLTYDTSKNDIFIQLKYNVKLIQNGKHAFAKVAEYKKENASFVLKEDIEFVTDNLQWLIDKQKKNSFNNEEMANAMDQRTTINGELLEFDTNKKMLSVKQRVKVSVEDKLLEANRLFFDDESGMLSVKGFVKLKKDDGSSIKADELRIDVYNEEIDIVKGELEKGEIR